MARKSTWRPLLYLLTCYLAPAEASSLHYQPVPTQRNFAAGSECARVSALYDDLVYSGFLPQTPDCHSISIDFSYAPKKM